jgi:triosephosphate isomerase
MCNFIRNKINKNTMDEVKNLKIIYGGSVNTKNALQLFALESVDGGLIGRASLDISEFVSICKAATPITN